MEQRALAPVANRVFSEGVSQSRGCSHGSD